MHYYKVQWTEPHELIVEADSEDEAIEHAQEVCGDYDTLAGSSFGYHVEENRCETCGRECDDTCLRCEKLQHDAAMEEKENGTNETVPVQLDRE